MSDCLEGALYLVSCGVRVFPLHGMQPGSHRHSNCTCGDLSCKSPGKHPLAMLAPHGLKHATTNEQIVRDWFSAALFANIGMATGEFVVLDVDPRHGGDATVARLEAEQGPLPQTTRADTGGGGQHIFFSAPTGIEIRNSAGALGPGLDVRGAGGYIVAPPSLHASGRRYTWSNDHHPYHVSPAPMPSWLVGILTRSQGQDCVRDQTVWRKLVTEGVPEGGRNTAVARLTGHLLRRYVDAQVAHELVQSFNATRCYPPLEPEEVTTIVGSVARRERQRREARNAIGA